MDYKQFFANTPEEYFGTMLQSVTEMHEAHLKTSKFSDHKALNEFYDEMPDLVDDVIEHYQGINGKLKEYSNNFAEAEFASPIEYLECLREFVESGKKEFCKESELGSDIDSILSQIDSTLYQLKELGESKSLRRSLKDYLLESLE